MITVTIVILFSMKCRLKNSLTIRTLTNINFLDKIEIIFMSAIINGLTPVENQQLVTGLK